MRTHTERAVRQERTGTCLRLIFPRRSLRHGTAIVVVLLVMGVATFVAVLGFVALMTGIIPPTEQRIPYPVLVAGMALAVFLGAPTRLGLLPWWWGTAGLFGHREIELHPDAIRTTERCGPFHRCKRWNAAEISSLELRPLATGSLRAEPPPIDLFGPFNALLLHSRERGRGMLAWGYPEAMLEAVAHEIASYFQQQPVDAAGGKPRTIAVRMPQELR